jgi:(R,R)-butanediol dehydrogenase/meso-butanediol dehydrogenase/diacetyl reductase
MTSGHGDTFAAGRVPGHEYSGEIVELGHGVTRLKVGDLVTSLPTIGCGQCSACLQDDPMRCAGTRVSASHGFAEYVIVGERSAVKMPAMVSFADAALTEPLCCGLRCVYLAKIQPGARVLVIGAGPIGLATAYWARRLGAGPIVVTARSARAARIASEMGATSFLVATDTLAQEAAEALGGAPEIVFECSGAVGMIARSVECVRFGGAVGIVGYCSVADSLVPSRAVLKELTFFFSFVYSRKDFEHSLNVMNSGDIAASAMITHTVSLDELPAAFEDLRHPKDQCKVMLAPWKI